MRELTVDDVHDMLYTALKTEFRKREMPTRIRYIPQEYVGSEGHTQGNHEIKFPDLGQVLTISWLITKT